METTDQEQKDEVIYKNPISDKASNRPSFRTLENDRQKNNKTTTQYSNLMLNVDSGSDLHNPQFLSGSELRHSN